jgi:galactokinase
MLFRAPGRVNLIGEHTDYNDGFVLPAAIDRDTVVAVGPASGGLITTVATDFGDSIDRFAVSGSIVRAQMPWADYVRGMAKMLADDGQTLAACNMAIAGDVPLGSGLSSSASLEIAVGLSLSAMARNAIEPTRLAKLAQRAENEFVGCACGIMDQLISACGMAGHALLIDCRSLECTPVPIPAGVSIVIAHSGVRHAHAGGEYNDRRQQCRIAAEHYAVAALRDLTVERLKADKRDLDDISYRRAHHVVTENARTLDAAQALRNGDLEHLGRLMAQSHQSMRDDFEITVPAVDQLSAIMANSLAGNGGARMTGGGFGGCVVAVTADDRVPGLLMAIDEKYRTPDALPAEVFVCQSTNGASQI